MHRYDELEKLYYKKLYLKIVIVFLIITLIVISLFFSLKKHKKQVRFNTVVVKVKKNKKENNVSIPKPKRVVKNVKKTIQKEKQKEMVILNFVLPDINAIKVSFQNNETKKITKKTVKEKKQPEQFSIKEKEVSLKKLINKYESNKNYDLALTIAKIYLKRNDLENAKKWALKANNLSPSKAESWILFADILIKENDMEKARNILEVYIHSYGKNDKIENKLRSLNDK